MHPSMHWLEYLFWAGMAVGLVGSIWVGTSAWLNESRGFAIAVWLLTPVTMIIAGFVGVIWLVWKIVKIIFTGAVVQGTVDFIGDLREALT